MKRVVFLTIVFLAITGRVFAQDIQIKNFKRNYTNLIASMDPVYDNAGDACSVIRFFARDNNIEIEPNLGILKREDRSGEIRLWVPIGTKRVTIRREGFAPLRGYELPLRLEPKVTYDADVELKEKDIYPQNRIYAGIGYNIVSISGPSVSFGVEFSKHMIELSAVYGLNKTDDWNFFNNNGDVIASYNYQAFRIGLRYGYVFNLTNYVAIIPQIGAAYNIMNGKKAAANVQNDSYKSANSISGLAALRATITLSKNIQLQITPEYDFGLSKNDKCKLISNNDKTFKSWTDGFNLNAGLMICF